MTGGAGSLAQVGRRRVPSAIPGRTLPVAVLIVNYNGRDLLKTCLDSWQLADPAPSIVLVVDNASSDGSVQVLSGRHPWVRWLSLPENVGFAAGNNRGFEWLRRQHRDLQAVFLCNNDTTVHPRMLDPLWRALEEHAHWAAVGPRILRMGDKTVWYDGATIEPWFGRGRHWRCGQLPGEAGPSFELPQRGFVTGCGMLLRWKALESLGSFDEGLWAYGEDADWCLRARVAGWACGVAPEAVMEHAIGASFSKQPTLRDYLFARNSLRLIRRHRLGPRPGLWPWTAATFLGLCAWWVLRRLARGELSAARAVIAGALDLFHAPSVVDATQRLQNDTSRAGSRWGVPARLPSPREAAVAPRSS